MTNKESRGICKFCEQDFAKRSMTKHLTGCQKRQETIETANTGKTKDQTLYHLVIQDAYLKEFWLHLEINGNAKLEKLDEYLRAIWLECCHHLSEFTTGGWGSEDVWNAINPPNGYVKNAFTNMTKAVSYATNTPKHTRMITTANRFN